MEPEKLRGLFEAARWAASCFSEQPWRFIWLTKADPEQFERVLGTLMPKNQEWAKTAWALGISAGKKTFTHNGAPDRFGLHDRAPERRSQTLCCRRLPSGFMSTGWAASMPPKARTEFDIPDDFEIGAAFAIGYLDGSPEPPADRPRRPLEEQVFGTEWGKASSDIGYK